MAAEDSTIRIGIDVGKKILNEAKGNPAKIVAYGVAAGIAGVGAGVGYGVYKGVNRLIRKSKHRRHIDK